MDNNLDMDEVMKMLRAIINGQSALKQELLGEIAKLDSKVVKVHEEIKNVNKKLTERLDKIGKSVAYLEDDALTREEHSALEKRVGKIERKLSS